VRPTRRRLAEPQADVSDLDRRILEHLQEDGRRPYTQIASQLGVSEAAVRARTNRMIEKGIVQIVGITNPLKLGFRQMAMVGVRCEATRLLDVAEEVSTCPEVDYVVVTA
jgi:Lrp/AsnC family transcriptional regulator, regulator for asnA, asnC and gidA